MKRTERRTRLVAVLAAIAAIAAGCGSGDNAATQSSPGASTVNPSDMSNNQAPPNRLVVDVTIKGGAVTPINAQLQAARGEQIILRVTSDAADQLHVHSEPEHTFDVHANPSQVQSFQFSVDVPGRIDVELHELNKTLATITVQ